MTPPRSYPRLQTLVVGVLALVIGAMVVTMLPLPADFPGWLSTAALASLFGVAAGFWSLRQRLGQARQTALTEGLAHRQHLERLQQRIRGLTDSQGRFVGSIAHELKTPLATVLAQSELLVSCSDDAATVRRYGKAIGEDMRHLSSLVESFLRLARPFAQEDRSQHAPVFFNDAVIEAISRSRSAAAERSVRLIATLTEPDNGDAAVEVLGDAVLLEAMVENLVRNAIRFSPRQGAVSIVVEARPAVTVLFVRDQGKGIPVEHHAAVFDWFFDPSPEARRSFGTGFGLAIVRRVAEHHGGTIALRNRAEGGSEFEIQLPTWRAEDGATTNSSTPNCHVA